MFPLPLLDLVEQPDPPRLKVRDRLREVLPLREPVYLLARDTKDRRYLAHSSEPQASPLHPPHARDNARAAAKNG